ncbi:precursor of cep4 [Quercus suber]|uniref:Precursor of cep4 n=1 Tax=Quercus suber TaxID=58331 RepID=A0AAW0K975_QUESU
MANKTFMITIFMVILLLQQNLSPITASRPTDIDPIRSLTRPKPPSTWFTINRYKMAEIEDFRPTTPGHSPGAGHDHPPVAIQIFMANETFMITIFMVILLLYQNLSPITASRPTDIDPTSSLTKPKPPSTWFTINRFKMAEIEDFRPTTPGHSPGAGHDHPPVVIQM